MNFDEENQTLKDKLNKMIYVNGLLRGCIDSYSHEWNQRQSTIIAKCDKIIEDIIYKESAKCPREEDPLG